MVPTAPASSGTPLALVKPPRIVAGELSRRVFTRKDGHPSAKITVHRDASGGQEYGIQAACTSATAGKTLSVEVRSGRPGASDEPIATDEIPCDGTVAVNGLGTLPAEAIVAALRGDHADVSSAYVIVAPMSSLPADK